MSRARPRICSSRFRDKGPTRRWTWPPRSAIFRQNFAGSHAVLTMQFLKQFFTWWNGQTLNTRYYTWRNGEAVGQDEFGNRYYRAKSAIPDSIPERRWVIFKAIRKPRPFRPAGMAGCITGLIPCLRQTIISRASGRNRISPMPPARPMPTVRPAALSAPAVPPFPPPITRPGSRNETATFWRRSAIKRLRPAHGQAETSP